MKQTVLDQATSGQPPSSQAASSQTVSSEIGHGKLGKAAIATALSESERAVLEALREIRYGEVEVVVHGSRIVQITRSQKLRVDGR